MVPASVQWTEAVSMNEQVTVDLDAVRGWVDVLRAIKERRVALDELEARARSHVEAALGDSEVGTVDGVPEVRWSHTKGRKTINVTRLRKELPDIAEVYTETGDPGRRFEVLEVPAGPQAIAAIAAGVIDP
jgi:hypothetical protein